MDVLMPAIFDQLLLSHPADDRQLPGIGRPPGAIRRDVRNF